MRVLVIATLLLSQVTVLADTVLEEIVVSAQKREQSLNEVPISLSVLPGAYIEQRDFNTLDEISANDPSFTISRNSNASKVYMRGIGSQGNAGLDQSVSIFIDEVYHPAWISPYRSLSTRSITDVREIRRRRWSISSESKS
jgi:outer membrane receptor protein involved in Fe transport